MMKHLLTRRLLFASLLLMLMSGTGWLHAQNYGPFASGVFLHQNGSGTSFNTSGSGGSQINPGGSSFSGNLGTFQKGSGTLVLDGGEVKTYKNPGANVCGAYINYSIHPAGQTGTYTEVSLPFKANCMNGVFTDGLGSCSGNDQKWSLGAGNIDLTQLCPGNYVVDVYYRIPGSSSSTSSCDENTYVGSASSPAGSMTFTIEGTPLSVTAMAGPPVCEGDAVDQTAIASGGTSPYNYIWQTPDGSSVYLKDFSATMAGTYTVKVIDDCDMEATATDQVIIKPKPAPPTVGDGSDIYVCEGAIATLSASGCSGTVTWSTGATGATISAGPGVYTATCTVDGCVSDASSGAVVIETQTTVPIIAGPQSVCSGATATLQAFNCSGDVTWSNGATGTSISAGPGTYTATCTVNGCASSPSNPFTLAPKPVSLITINGPILLCEGGTGTLTAVNCDGTVHWSTGETGSSISAGPGTYSASCTGMNGCSGPPKSFTIGTKPKPAPPTVGDGSDIYVCEGATATLSASGCSGTVTWSTDATGATISAGPGVYTATCTVNGCESDNSSIAVVIETQTSAPIIAGAANVCPGATTTLHAFNCEGDITWSNGATGTSISASPGTYTATCTANGCVSQPSSPLTVTQTNVTPPSVTNGGINCTTNEATLTASGCANGTITWSNGSTGSSINVAPGAYTATCTVNGCVSSASDSVKIMPCSGPPCPPYPPAPPPPPPACASGGLLVNGSFESGIAPYPYSLTTQPGWTNVGQGSNGQIEAWQWGTEGVYAPNGNQIVELNATSLGILTQNVTVTPGVPINLSYYHKSRSVAGEKLRIDIVDVATGALIHTFQSTSTTGWTKFSTMFTSTSSHIQLRVVSLNSCNNGSGDAGCGNLIDNFVMKYSACECPNLPTAPVVCTPATDLCNGASATLTAQGCPGGTIKWSNGQTGPTLTTNVPGTYYAQCIMPGSTCNQSPNSNSITLGGCSDVSVTCPTFEWRTNGVYHIRFCVKNNGNSPASGTAYFKLNGSVVYTEYYSGLAPGATKCFIYRARYLPCGSTVNVEVGSTVVGTDSNPSNNTCSGSKPMACVPNPPPYDPNYKDAMPKRSLEGGIFPADEWITYTIHCQNDGTGVAHNVVMIDTIDITKLNIDSIQIVSSWDPVQFAKINDKIVSFTFSGVDLTSSSNDLPNSQTEVVFKIKRLPGQPIGTEILNRTGIYFDQEVVVETEYAFSKIIEPCPASDVHPGVVSSDQYVAKGATVNTTFNLSGQEGIITGWQVSTDPTFANNVTTIANYTNQYAFNQVVDTPTYIRAMVQTGGCAITGSTAATIQPVCGNLIKNGSFENPVVANNAWVWSTIPDWKNLVDNNKIEVQRNHATTATEGLQYAELNGYVAGSIYQDVTVIPSTTLSWKLDHRARVNNNETISVTLSAPDGSNSQSFTHKGSKTAWQTFGNVYNVAAGQTAVRMKITATVSSAPNLGNFIDNVSLEYAGCSSNVIMSANVMTQEANTGIEMATLNVVPNPVTSNAEISLRGFDDGNVNLIVTDATGKTLNSLQYNYKSGSPYIIDLTSLKAGFYLIKVEQNGKSATAKVLKN